MASALPFMEPLHVVGAGSIGLFIASSIRSSFPSFPLAVLFRGQHRGSNRFPLENGEIVICTRQLPVSSSAKSVKGGRPQLARVPYQFTDDHRRCKRMIRNLLLCTKAYQAESAIRELEHRLDPSNLRILLLCNGALDVREKLQNTLWDKINPVNLDLIMCTTTHGVINETSHLKEDNEDDEMFHLFHVGQGKTYIGSGKQCTKSIAQLFDQSGLNAQSIESEQMEVLLWQKLAANCVCNPLTALWNVPNGKLHENPSFSSLKQQIVQEVSTVGIAMFPDFRDKLNAASLNGFVDQVIQANLQNKSSMDRDIKQRKRTEADNLNGFIVRSSTKLGLGSMPANEELLGKIQDITASYL